MVCARLENVTRARPAFLSTGDLAEFDRRRHRFPVTRIHRLADYFALRSVEQRYVRRVSSRLQLTEGQRQEVDDWWLTVVQEEMHEPLLRIHERLADRRRLVMTRWSKLVRYPLLFETIGPGGRTWVGNRYTTVRLLTFRLHWRA
jgi:hypothetical protein